jgi:hypothetical protein
MAYSWSEIERDWLDGSEGLAASADDVLAAFNRVASLFGHDWVQASQVKGALVSRGPLPTLSVVALGRMLEALDGVAKASSLLNKVRDRQADARAELLAIYLMRRDNPEAVVEIEPEVRVGSRNRMPDFRVRRGDEPWTYVEVTNPGESELQQEVLRGLERITNLVYECSGSFALEVFLSRPPVLADVEFIAATIMQGQPTELATVQLPSGLGALYWNYQPPGVAVLDDHGEPYTPRLSRSSIAVGGGEHRHIVVRWPFTDTRAEKFIRLEARQLPTDSPGLIMIQTSGNVGAMKSWRALIDNRFRPTQYTRVGAVCLFSSGFVPTETGEDWRATCKIIANPHARFPVPEWILEQLGQFPSDESDI